jgi:uncharacterized protein (DUF2235 family)
MGRIFSLIFSIFGVFVTSAAGTWWFNTVAIGLLLRRLERYRVVRQGSITACIGILLIIWAVFSVLTTGLVFVIFLLLKSMLRDWLETTLPKPLFNAGYVFVIICLVLAVGAGVFAGLSEVRGAIGAAKRRRFLFNPTNNPNPAIQDVDIPAQSGPGRRIVILCDGTSNRPDNHPEGESIATNIWKLSGFLRDDDTQTVWYEAGVGSDSSSTAVQAKRTQYLLSLTGFAQGTKIFAGVEMLIKLVESGFGVGISETIVNGYSAIVRLYRPGDRIYLIGFSRGAFAARCIAGVISRCGLLRAEYERFAPDVVQIYRTRTDPDKDEPMRLDIAYPAIGSGLEAKAKHAVAIEFVGVFDTVASLGFPLWGWWFRVAPVWQNLPFSTDPSKVCRNIYHALAMDERRAQFFPTLYTMPTSGSHPDVMEQVWFRGAHADIGGGYPRHDVSDIPLHWMMDAMSKHGLEFRPGAKAAVALSPVATLHDELVRDPTWNFFGSWPRWHPVPGNDEAVQTSKLHTSVIERAAVIERQTGRPDLLRIRKREELVVITNSPWFRTGIIIEKDRCYRVTYLGGLTRNGQRPPADPGGQRIRRFSLFNPRLPGKNWMFLGASIAHPRVWTPQERGLMEGIRYLLGNGPELLLDQIAMIGHDLAEVNDSVFIRSTAPSGLLYFFVNDVWHTAGNNSGGPRLSIEPLDESDASGVLFTLEHRIETDLNGQQNEINQWKRSRSTRSSNGSACTSGEAARVSGLKGSEH